MSRDHSRGRTLLKPVVLTTEPVGGEPADGALAIARAEDLIDTQGFTPPAYATFISDTGPSGPPGRHAGSIQTIVPIGGDDAAAFAFYNPGSGALAQRLRRLVELVVTGGGSAQLDNAETRVVIGGPNWPGFAQLKVDPDINTPNELMKFTSGVIEVGQKLFGPIEFSLQTVLNTPSPGPFWTAGFELQKAVGAGAFSFFQTMPDQGVTGQNIPFAYGLTVTQPFDHTVGDRYRLVGRRIGGPAADQQIDLRGPTTIKCRMLVEGAIT